MSKISFKPADTGTATFTIEAPATNTNRTLTLPDEAGSVLTNGGAINVDQSAPAESAVIDSSGNVGIGTSSPAVALDVSGQMRASSGILFGTDTAAVNTLDDYEEGTFSPAHGGTTFTNAGRYTKVGNVVFITILFDNPTTGSSTSASVIEGLPFVVDGLEEYAATPGRCRYVDMNSGEGAARLRIVGSGFNRISARTLNTVSADDGSHLFTIETRTVLSVTGYYETDS